MSLGVGAVTGVFDTLSHRASRWGTRLRRVSIAAVRRAKPPIVAQDSRQSKYMESNLLSAQYLRVSSPRPTLLQFGLYVFRTFLGRFLIPEDGEESRRSNLTWIPSRPFVVVVKNIRPLIWVRPLFLTVNCKTDFFNLKEKKIFSWKTKRRCYNGSVADQGNTIFEKRTLDCGCIRESALRWLITSRLKDSRATRPSATTWNTYGT